MNLGGGLILRVSRRLALCESLTINTFTGVTSMFPRTRRRALSPTTRGSWRRFPASNTAWTTGPRAWCSAPTSAGPTATRTPSSPSPPWPRSSRSCWAVRSASWLTVWGPRWRLHAPTPYRALSSSSRTSGQTS